MMDSCRQIAAMRDFDRLETLISCGLQNLGHDSRSMQPNVFSLISVSSVRSRDSDFTDDLYSPCSTTSLSFLDQRDQEAVLLWSAEFILPASPS